MTSADPSRILPYKFGSGIARYLIYIGEIRAQHTALLHETRDEIRALKDAVLQLTTKIDQLSQPQAQSQPPNLACYPPLQQQLFSYYSQQTFHPTPNSFAYSTSLPELELLPYRESRDSRLCGDS
ncbi:hypothetical protein Ddc_12952 [Ditylenchus destructor]|nr:hypothetical protein Ddc_12952 [Ditylenchus destructor]